MGEWKETILEKVAYYVNEKVKTDCLTEQNYISTENMLPNLGGITKVTTIPDGKCTRYQSGDILVSNIRPYFKKLWKAQFEGGCSNDVLVIRSNGEIDADYLAYYLSSNNFFDYVMAGSNGTKMPRGNKGFTMTYPLVYPSDKKEQQRIASIMSSYDELIEVNNRRIALLEESARELYKEWFVRFRFPGYQYAKFNKGLPEGWKEERLDKMADIKVGGDKPADFVLEPTNEKNIPIYSNGESQKGLMGYTSHAKIKTNCITVSARGNVGYVCLRRHAFTPIVRLLAVIPQKEIMDELYLYQFLLNYEFFATGAAQQQITAPMLKQMKVIRPEQSIRLDFYNKCDKIYLQIESLEKQNAALAAARDRLLPRLISGKIRV